jgi:uncharacterized ion transporter superfamily protein YfcC
MDRSTTTLTSADAELADAYLAGARTAKLRRLAGLVVLCGLLVAVLVTVFARGWYSQSGGAGWVICGIVVAGCAIGGVVIDIAYRKEL